MNDLKRYADGIFGDYRRAAAIIAHHARGDGDGVNAILADAANHKRCSELVIAILGLYELAVPHITDDNVIATIQQLALTWAQTEKPEGELAMTEPLTDIPADALPDDTPAAPEQLAPEADQAGDLTSNSTSDTDVDDQGDGKAGRDAAKYRARLRETETERDQLRDQLNAQRRATVDWRASSKSVDSALLDAAGINIDELVDAETGHVDMPKVDAFIEATADRFKVRRGFEPNRGQGQSGAPAAKPSLSDAFRPR